MASQTSVAIHKRKKGRPVGSTAGKTRARLLDAAAVQFNSYDFADVSLSAIAKEAGLTSAAIYNHFGSKDELFIATIKSRIQQYNQLIADALEVPGNWKVRFSGLLKNVKMMQGEAGGFPLIVSVVQTRLQREPEKFREIIELRSETLSYFQLLVSDAIDCGDFPRSIDKTIAAELLMACSAGAINTVSLYHPTSQDMDEIIFAFLALLGIADKD